MDRDPRIDAYIDEAPSFARPILLHLRALVHAALPGLGETIKWRMPHFTLNGKNLAGMAAFKAHCAFVIHGGGRQGMAREDGMGDYGRITSLADLPSDGDLSRRLVDAAASVASGEKRVRPASLPRGAIPMPDDLAQALAAHPAAQAVFDGFAPSHRRDYLEWIIEAKQPATRQRRIAQTVEWVSEGKRRNWKYEKC
ncbi:MAG: YdeI/OmpD-associated family protein [Sphingomonadales bacterium]|nr:YdeI/OmpD-associated family protein [Sphingomonadales bacterium]MDE2169084.1 YdeI/OmpD-associated family protein [Sphingomonadales bacterium]